MSLTNKIILCGFGIGLLLASSAQAGVKSIVGQNIDDDDDIDVAEESVKTGNKPAESSKPEAMLFRVENIKPLANTEGVTERCSYMVTAYNRSDRPLKDAKLVLTWTDNISGKYKVEDSKLAVVKNAVKLINSEITIDNVAPHKQKSFEQRVDTDKCYLLLDNTQFKVTSCEIEGLGKMEAGKCTEFFNYIDSKNPEYYSEFKDVPATVLEKQIEDEKKQEIAKIEETIGKINKTMDETTEILRKLK